MINNLANLFTTGDVAINQVVVFKSPPYVKKFTIIEILLKFDHSIIDSDELLDGLNKMVIRENYFQLRDNVRTG